jgi:hypothetical protein
MGHFDVIFALASVIFRADKDLQVPDRLAILSCGS